MTLRLRWGPGALDTLERDAVRLALEAADGNQTRAAELLGVQRLVIARAIDRHGLTVTRPKRSRAKPRE